MFIISVQRQKSDAVKELKQRTAAIMDEAVALCPKCKTFETVWFTSGRLNKTRKFRQEDTGVYHDCGSKYPCLLLPRFQRRIA